MFTAFAASGYIYILARPPPQVKKNAPRRGLTFAGEALSLGAAVLWGWGGPADGYLEPAWRGFDSRQLHGYCFLP
jgi:hypothetical protein